MGVPKFILASASPRRKELLLQAKADFEIIPAEIDETPHNSESPHVYVLRLSLEKAKAISAKSKLPVLGSDTVVSIDGELLGKPANKAEALVMLNKLNGKSHLVHTGVSLYSEEITESFFTETKVKFIDASPEEIESYIDSGEPFDKAGGYGIQGIGSFLVEFISGSYTGVVGLPVAQTIQLLKKYSLWNLNK
jgi:septum formation protein